jgi:hypothetical protein
MEHVETCRLCGRGPATELVIRRHQGMLVLQRFIRVKARLCRDCGRRTIKQYTGRTLIEGWWGVISFFANWFCLATNAIAWLRASRLPEPEPAAESDERLAA